MCSALDDPSTYELRVEPPRSCENPLWLGGTIRPCGRQVGVKTWTDTAGMKHTACRAHVVIMQRRWVPALSEPRDPLFSLDIPTRVAAARAFVEAVPLPQGYSLAVSGRHFKYRSKWTVDLLRDGKPAASHDTYDLEWTCGYLRRLAEASRRATVVTADEAGWITSIEENKND